MLNRIFIECCHLSQIKIGPIKDTQFKSVTENTVKRIFDNEEWDGSMCEDRYATIKIGLLKTLIEKRNRSNLLGFYNKL